MQKTTRITATLFAALLLLLSVMPMLAQDNIPVELPVIYTTADGSVTLNLPEGWVAEESNPGEITLTNAPELQTASIITEAGQVAGVFQVIDSSLLPTDGPVSLEQMANFFRISASSANALEFNEPEPVTINEQPGLRLESIGGQIDQVLYVLDLGEGQYATLIAATAAGTLPAVEATLVAILQNFSFDPAAADAAEAVQEAAGPQSFVSAEGALRFEYPAGWLVVAQGGQVNFASSSQTLQATSAAEIMPGEVGGAILAGPGDVFPVEEGEGPLNAEAIAALFAGDGEAAAEGEPAPLTFSEPDFVTAADREVVVRMAETEDRDQVLVVSEIGDGNFGVIIGLTAPGSAESVTDELVGIISSMRFDADAAETLAVGDPQTVTIALPQTYTTENGTLTFDAPDWPAEEESGQVLLASSQPVLESEATTELESGEAIALVYAVSASQAGLPPGTSFDQAAAVIASNITRASGVNFTSPVSITLGERAALVGEAYSVDGEQALVLLDLGEDQIGVLIGFAPSGELAEVEAVLLAIAQTMQVSSGE